MASSLYPTVIFGPVRSRRLGLSLGINLLPTTLKYCTFNCIYCECGWTDTASVDTSVLVTSSEVGRLLNQKVLDLSQSGIYPQSLTFAGNGEPTSHPDFARIVQDTLALRDRLLPGARVSVLSNSTMKPVPEMIEALSRTYNLMKLDAGSEEIFRLINKPCIHTSLDEITRNLKLFQGNLVIQSMFLKGEIHGRSVSNTGDVAVESWLSRVVEIGPREVMLYSLDRVPPASGLVKVSYDELMALAHKVAEKGIKASVY